LGQDVEATAAFGSIRRALELIVSRLPAQEFFVGAAERGLSTGIVASIDEVLVDPHFVEREFAVTIVDTQTREEVTYPGAPFQMKSSPWRIRHRAPRLGEHDADVLGPLH
jgi:crotonobetainyl-CoA:carnitine CoA-transferase CaiB-like acyl-CoA transferase